MENDRDKQNCLKNLLTMILIDGEVDRREMDFLKNAAAKLEIAVADWKQLVRLVQEDGTPVYPIEDRTFAVEVLKALMAMARKDDRVEDAEKRLLLVFSKSIGISRAELKEALALSAKDGLFDPPERADTTFLVITTDFEKIDDFVKTFEGSGVGVKLVEYKDALHGDALKGLTIVCLHGAIDQETTVKRCSNLLHKNKDLFIVPILGRYQGNYVKYLHEIGIKRCFVEPVFPIDVANILRDTRK
jgi:hypothetical protein